MRSVRRLESVALLPPASIQLDVWQREVDAGASFEEQVAAAKAQFTAKNRKGNLTFDAVKEALALMCAGVRRCVYCEDSLADEVEHLRPKYFYPGQVFAWSNYVFACGPCNAFKGSKFAVFVEGTRMDLVRRRDTPPTPPPVGVYALLDPRAEDVNDLLGLDLQDTFYFLPRATKGTLLYERVEVTIELLGLNEREALPRARRAAYADFKALLVTAAKHGDDPAELARLGTHVRERQHPSVWHEMKRQQTKLPALAALFGAAPAALGW